MIEIFSPLHKELSSGRKAVLAVVTQTWGSAPRGIGSLMLVREDGSFEGSVSGGCVEGTVIAEAQALLADASASKRLEFAVSNDDAFAVGLACGGTIRVSLFALTPPAAIAVTTAIKAIEGRSSGTITFSYIDGTAAFITQGPGNIEDGEAQLALLVRARPSLAIIGAVHIAQELAPMAARCGFEVTVIDPRASFLEARSFSGAAIINDWPDEYLSQAPLGAFSALVTLTHDPKLDDAALHPALSSDAFYIGCLGSKKTHASRLERLKDQGFDDTTLNRLHGPVGLNIGARTPAEIAVAILAEIVATMRKGATDAV